MTDFATDPEIAADLIRQARSERDKRRTRGEGIYDRVPEPVVETWPCRTGCGARVDMTASAIEQVALANRALVSRGDQPLTKREVMLCGACRAVEHARGVERDRDRAASIAALTRELRRGVFPWREAAIADELRGLGVEKPEELIKQIAIENRTAPTGARRTSL